MSLIDQNLVIGIFRGFTQAGLEFHADLVLPYRPDYHQIPMHGQFVVVELEHNTEAVLGRITSILSEGRLTSPSGEDYSIRAIAEQRQIPKDLKEQYLRYRVNIRVLGVLREADRKVIFAPSQRRLPHVGSRVAFLSADLLKEVSGHNVAGADLGFYALGEFVYGGGDKRCDTQPWMRQVEPAIISKFPIDQLVSRRTFVFARAGFGKSNLVKLLFSLLYEKDSPTVTKRGDRRVPVGTVIFDLDGEYFWPDDKNRPGLCDVKHLQDKLVVFTDRESPSGFYGSFVAGGMKLDIRRFRPSDVISIALSPEKQDQQNVRKLKGLNDRDWGRLVDEIYRNRNGADPGLLKQLLHLEDSQEAEMVAARANMTAIVTMLHDPSSLMLDTLLGALRRGYICVIDVSKLRGTAALVLSGLILRRIFNHNQEQFTRAQPESIPCIAVLEEAQTVLGNTSGASDTPYVEWVKEGRKYDLGAVLVTQQPGSISQEILSQGDNWFVFHLLSAGDLTALHRANGHFSEDILTSLLNEPIPGNAIFWSSAGGKTYPVPTRVLLFEHLYKPEDPKYLRPAVETSARKLAAEIRARIGAQPPIPAPVAPVAVPTDEPEQVEQPVDILSNVKENAIQRAGQNGELLRRIREVGIPWRGVLEELKKQLPEDYDDRDRLANELVPEFLNRSFGEKGWKTDRRPSKSKRGAMTVWVLAVDHEADGGAEKD